jgi:hypothetical protein
MRKAGNLGRTKPHSRETHPRVMLDKHLVPKSSITVPTAVDVASKVSSWPMYLNDTLGDCTCAAVGHILQAWTAYASTEVKVTDSDVEKLYEIVGGYVPGDPSTDQGANMQDILSYWQKSGIPGSGHKISAFAELDNFYDVWNLKQALYLFGTVYLGINCPASAQDQFSEGLPWSYVPGSEIEGGHAICLQKTEPVGSETGIFNVVTWGALQPATINFLRHYVEEAWVALTPDWIAANGDNPFGFSYADLQADFDALNN